MKLTKDEKKVKREWYQANRDKLLAAEKLRQAERIKYPVYHALIYQRRQRWNWQESIRHYRGKIQLFQKRLSRQAILIEKLELEWGQIRSKLKREGKLTPTKELRKQYDTKQNDGDTQRAV